MLHIANPQININAVSETNEHKRIAEFNGSYNNNDTSLNNFSLGMRVVDINLYIANKAAVDADLLAFKDELLNRSGILPEEETNEEE